MNYYYPNVFVIVLLILIFYYSTPYRFRLESRLREYRIDRYQNIKNKSPSRLSIRELKLEEERKKLGPSKHELKDRSIEEIIKKSEKKDTDQSPGIFDDTVYYENREEDGLNSGILKCLKECDGNCLEYGITGVAWCYPKEKN